ncbi:MAG: peptidoglycan-binding domain-containing protein [Shimia sp.]
MARHHPSRRGLFAALVASAAGLAACTAPDTVAERTAATGGVTGLQATRALQTRRGTACFAEETSPAVIETVTEQVAIPGTTPTAYRTVTRQQIVNGRTALRFETPCPPVFTPDFVASLQRALAVRGHYRGAVTGQLDAATKRAVLSYQSAEGPRSETLSMAAARRLGLVAVGRDGA